MEYTIYVDALCLIMAFLMVVHWLILWATGQILKVETNWKRVALGSLIGTICDCLGLLLELVEPGMVARTSEAAITLVSLGLACRICFPKASRNTLFRALGYVYLFTIVSAGSSMMAYYLSGENTWISRLVAIGSLVVLIEAGWGVIQNRIWPANFRIAVEVGVGGSETIVDALIDTGNSLKDPFSKTPVVVLEYDAISRLIPEEVRSVFQRGEADAFASIAQLVPGAAWAARLRVIPFSSLGRDDGILVGFKPDYVRIHGSDGVRTLTDIIVGVHPKRLSPEGSYQALLNPEILEVGVVQTNS